MIKLILFAEQETEGSWIHWMFASGNVLFFIGKYCEMLLYTLFVAMLKFSFVRKIPGRALNAEEGSLE